MSLAAALTLLSCNEAGSPRHETGSGADVLPYGTVADSGSATSGADDIDPLYSVTFVGEALIGLSASRGFEFVRITGNDPGLVSSLSFGPDVTPT